MSELDKLNSMQSQNSNQKQRALQEKMIIDLTPSLLDNARGYPKKLGRYSCSQIFKMLEASKLPWGLPVEKYFEIEEPTLEGALRMYNGVQTHELVQKLLGSPEKNEVKFEYEYCPEGSEKPIFVVVGKVDRLEDDSVFEFKSSDKEFTKAKDYHEHQAKLYCTICDRPTAHIFQPIVKDNHFILREIGTVTRDDDWFAGEMRRLLNYHQRLELLIANK